MILKAAAVSLGIIVLTGATLVISGRLNSNKNFPKDEVACTQDAKICPDGSSVGRVPPNCEFCSLSGENSICCNRSYCPKFRDPLGFGFLAGRKRYFYRAARACPDG